MDAKSRANFINSVASGSNVPCPKCGTGNEADSKFCIFCGTKINIPQEAQENAPAFEPAKEAPAFEPAKEAPAFESAKEAPAKVTEHIEPKNVFAQGLPNWSIEPPQVMVRRR